MKYVIGIDSGGTNYRLRAASLDGTILGSYVGRPASIYSLENDELIERIGANIDALLETFGGRREDALYILCGTTGADSDEDVEQIHRVYSSLPGFDCPVRILNDVQLAHYAVIGGPGVLIISGTGTIAYAVDAEGNEVRSGGWLFSILGDEGSGAWVSRMALRQLGRFYDGILPRSPLISKVEETGIGRRKVNYRLRDAIFSRQRYWGEPFPVYYEDGIAVPMDESELPLCLPEVDKYLPTESGEPPLARAADWNYRGWPIEKSTMPGFAGSSAYYLRYMDPRNDKALVDRTRNEYWKDVDLYVGGTEHATGHLIYSRFWNKFLYDLGYVCRNEPFRKLVNQGMIQGRSNFVYRIKGTNTFVSYNLRDGYDTTEIHVDVNLVHNDRLDMEAFRKWRPDFADAEFILEDGEYVCGWAVEKMSKSMFNVVNPDNVCDAYGKFWRLYYGREGALFTDKPASAAELKVLHKLIKKVSDDIEHFSMNTSVSAFMIAVNELNELGCTGREILEPMVVLLSPFAPHICEELWSRLGHDSSVSAAAFPEYEARYTEENTFEYPVSFNGKTRFKLELPKAVDPKDAEAAVMASPNTWKYLDGKPVRKIIVVPSKIINVVF